MAVKLNNRILLTLIIMTFSASCVADKPSSDYQKKYIECMDNLVVVPKSAFRGLALAPNDWGKAKHYLFSNALRICLKQKVNKHTTVPGIDINIEANYLKIPVDKRKLLEQIPELKKPFDKLKTFTGLNVEYDKSLKPYEKKALELALMQYEKAKTNYGNKLDICNKAKMIIPSTKFKGITLTNREWKMAMLVFNHSADDACSNSELTTLLKVASIYREAVKHYKFEPIMELKSYEAWIVFGIYWGALEAEAEYLEIPKTKRDKLENIPEMKKPFDPFGTLSGLNVE